MAGEPLPTGVEALDRQLDGGFPAGSIVAYCAPPASQSELLLYELTAARSTLYLTTQRSDHSVEDAFDRAQCPTGDPEIREVPSDAPLQHATQLLHQLGEGANLIIDPMDPLERAERNRYRNFLNDIQNHMVNTGSVTVVHCLRGDQTPELRDTTQHIADLVLDLTLHDDGNEIVTRLAIPKYRGGPAQSETIKLELAERIRVDTSRDIA